MSGGHFDYAQYRINDIASQIKEDVKSDSFCYSDETKAEFIKAIHFLEIASVYAQRVDWLMSGDDGEETFHKRLKQELENIEKGNQNV